VNLERIPIVTTTLTSAETIKYSANAFLALKIGFSNEMANICERIGADVTEVMRGIGLDGRIGLAFLNTAGAEAVSARTSVRLCIQPESTASRRTSLRLRWR